MISIRKVHGTAWEFAWGENEAAALEVLDQGWEFCDVHDWTAAEKQFTESLRLEPDLIDAYAGLGFIEFEHRRYAAARRYYQKGVSLGLTVLPVEFKGQLPWVCVDNRPFHRCLHGLGLTYMQGKDRVSAQALFRWGLRLAPDDGIGYRFLVAELRDKLAAPGLSEP